jgi:hypothetical protein
VNWNGGRVQERGQRVGKLSELVIFDEGVPALRQAVGHLSSDDGDRVLTLNIHRLIRSRKAAGLISARLVRLGSAGFVATSDGLPGIS